MLASAWILPAEEHAIERFGTSVANVPRAEVRAELASLLDSGRLVAALQPVVRLYDGTVIGYEALTRFPPSAHIATPDHLFSAASSHRLETALDVACMQAALRDASSIGDVDVFMNVLIRTLHDRQGMRALHDAVHAAGV
ncbi:MAG: EAL domain-containing protein, partial [Candidatus Dormibacteraeota bacterium]|nr:EAL domain-containing protein [Candidatus Dormibacteraeota bacterium]